eukprot:1274592-Rhodomonas_salina.1
MNTFNNNTAAVDGGGILVFECVLTDASSSTFTRNMAVGNGGGICGIGATSDLALTSTVFTANTADQ